MRTLFFALLLISAASAQVCHVYKTFNAAANAGVLLDTIIVPEQFNVGSVRVSNLVLGHPDPSKLELSLMHKSGPEVAFTTSALKASGAAYEPQQPFNGGAAGKWVLRITDSQPGADT